MKINPLYTAWIAGLNAADFLGWLMLEKIFHPLYRCLIIAAAGNEGILFKLLLKFNTGIKGMPKIIRTDLNKQSAVGVNTVAYFTP